MIVKIHSTRFYNEQCTKIDFVAYQLEHLNIYIICLLFEHGKRFL